MRTGRSLAHIKAYQAELPALCCTGYGEVKQFIEGHYEKEKGTLSGPRRMLSLTEVLKC
jgi:hypothetical protein